VFLLENQSTTAARTTRQSDHHVGHHRRLRGLQQQQVHVSNKDSYNDAASPARKNSSPTTAPTFIDELPQIPETTTVIRQGPKEILVEGSGDGNPAEWTRYRDTSPPMEQPSRSLPPPDLNQQEVGSTEIGGTKTHPTASANAQPPSKNKGGGGSKNQPPSKNKEGGSENEKNEWESPPMEQTRNPPLVVNEEEVVSTANDGKPPSGVPPRSVNTPTSNQKEGSKAKTDDGSEKEHSSNDLSADDIIAVQTVKVELETNDRYGSTMMDDEDIAIFEDVCESEFLPSYLPRVHAASSSQVSYTDIKCIVIEQFMAKNRSNLNEARRMLQSKEQQQQAQQQQQIANIQLDSGTFSTLLQILSTVVNDGTSSFSFTDIVAQTFTEYSYSFQEQLSQKTDYFESKQVEETVEPNSLKEEKQPPNTTASDSLSLAAKVGLGIGVFALAVVLVLALFVNRTSHRNNKGQNVLAVIVGDESLVSCIEPSEGQEVVFTKNSKQVIDDDDESDTTIDDIVLGDTASLVCQRIMNETKEDDHPMTTGISSHINKSKPIEMITGASRSQASDVSSVTQASSVGSTANNNNHNNNRYSGSVESATMCVGNLMAQLDLALDQAKKASSRISQQRSKTGLVLPEPASFGDEEGSQGEPAGACYPIPQLDLPTSAKFSSTNDSISAAGGAFGSQSSGMLPVTTGSMLSLSLYSLADSLSTAVMTARTASNLSSMLGDLTTTTDSSGGDDNIANTDSYISDGVETSIDGVVGKKSHNDYHGDDVDVEISSNKRQ
jgi:hypothetical protein